MSLPLIGNLLGKAVAQPIGTIPTGAVVVFALIFVALVLFVTEAVPNDIAAIGVLVSLAVLKPFTSVSAQEAISGFASPATVTIIAMYILSEGVRRTGVVHSLGRHIAHRTRGSERRLLRTTVAATGLSAGIVNNTPVVAIFIPMIKEIADRSRISPSRILLPLSYSAMLGGTLTLIGTSTNILASDISRRLLGHPISMFEFTGLGVIVFGVGAVYLLTFGRKLTPIRIQPEDDLTRTFELERHLYRLAVNEGSALVGMSVDEVAEGLELDLDFLKLERNGETFHAVSTDQKIGVGDALTVRSNLANLRKFVRDFGLRRLFREEVTEEELVSPETASVLIEAIVPLDSALVGDSVPDSKLKERFDTTVVAVRRGDETIKENIRNLRLKVGDTLLLQTTAESAEYLDEEGDIVITHGPSDEPEGKEVSLSPETPIALAIMVGVVGAAALDLQPIVISALGGVVAMVVTGCISPSEAYDSVNWNVIFLLAGVIPLGIAMQATGGAELIAGLLVGSADLLPTVAVLGLIYLVTGTLANVITPVASVILMAPIAVDTALILGSNPFAFLLAAMFAGSSAFATPMGYTANIMVYGPGGYRFTDYVKLGAPLQLILAVVTTSGISLFWGL